MPERKRSATVSVDIDAPAAAVWKALTDAREMVRWFPPHAEVEPGAGGHIVWRWDDAFTMAGLIEEWDPERRLVLVQEREPPHDADGRAADGAAPARLVMDFNIETRHGRTRLTLVHSGFGHGAEWDDELEGVANGWHFELRSLAHYLAAQRGRDRHTGWAHTTVEADHADVWRTLASADGFVLADNMRAAGAEYALTLPSGEALTGTSIRYVPEREWFGTARELDDGIVRIHTWRGGGRTGVSIWFATWNTRHATRVASLQDAAQAFLDARIQTTKGESQTATGG